MSVRECAGGDRLTGVARTRTTDSPASSLPPTNPVPAGKDAFEVAARPELANLRITSTECGTPRTGASGGPRVASRQVGGSLFREIDPTLTYLGRRQLLRL